MNKVIPAIIGTIMVIGLVRLFSNAIKGGGVLDVVGGTAISLGIALGIWYVVKIRSRQ